jgi:hypothetical protein
MLHGNIARHGKRKRTMKCIAASIRVKSLYPECRKVPHGRILPRA